ncbi:MAG: bifunctional transaldolase/phosoglucose isomerase [Thermoplasmatota archaeon]
MKRIDELRQTGQFVWLDYMRKGFLDSGEFARLVAFDGVSGVTANPSIFEKAIAGSSDYDDAVSAILAEDPRVEPKDLYERLAVSDLQETADILRSVYEKSGRKDGYVSLEVSPYLAHDAPGTIAEARRLWTLLDRRNAMIKVPGTAEGAVAIEELIAQGINVNVTLLFSRDQYEATAQAYLRGLARFGAAPSRDLNSVASVASLFVSRIDSAVDLILDSRTEPALAEVVRRLRGKVAIAYARVIYARYAEIFDSCDFALRGRGAQPQRLLWASTQAKDPAFRETLYLEELAGPETITTVPLATLAAFGRGGEIRGPTVLDDPKGARRVIDDLASLGIAIETIAEQLQKDGILLFCKAFDQILAALESKRRGILAASLPAESDGMGTFGPAIKARLASWDHDDVPARIWKHDPTVWVQKQGSAAEIENRLGWLTLPERMQPWIAGFHAFADSVRSEGIRTVVVLGMGGSSLAADVFARTFGSSTDHPELRVLSTSHPDAVRAATSTLDLSHTLFIVSSKSGTTVEPLALFAYFWTALEAVVDSPGRHFVAITDPGTPLAQLGVRLNFRGVFTASPDVGGRYSALTTFGLLPAATLGIDLEALLSSAWRMEEACAAFVAARDNPGLRLGAALGEFALAGRNKLTVVTPPGSSPFASWLEQLVAESLGKDGKGIVPILDEPILSPEAYAGDRVFVLMGGADHGMDGAEAGPPRTAPPVAGPSKVPGKSNRPIEESPQAFATRLAQRGHPVLRFGPFEELDMGAEMFRWEMAIVGAAKVLGVHPFNQPDVERAKELARESVGLASLPRGVAADREPKTGHVATVSVTDESHLATALDAFLVKSQAGDFLSIQAFLAPTPASSAALRDLRRALGETLRVPTTLGYGPSFLHSTGQLHKGGPPGGRFLQLVDRPSEDLPIMGSPGVALRAGARQRTAPSEAEPSADRVALEAATAFGTFGTLIAAQAEGDAQALRAAGRLLLRVHVGADPGTGIAHLVDVIAARRRAGADGRSRGL